MESPIIILILKAAAILFGVGVACILIPFLLMATVINDPIIARKVSVISGIGKAFVFIGVICAVIGGIVAAVTHFLG